MPGLRGFPMSVGLSVIGGILVVAVLGVWFWRRVWKALDEALAAILLTREFYRKPAPQKDEAK